VREFFITNGRYWTEEFHFDGFRFDATQDVHDESNEYIIGAIGRAARLAAGKRSLILVAENEPQETKLVQPRQHGGDDLDGLWNDDLHHSAIVALNWTKRSLLHRLPGTRRSSFPRRSTDTSTRVSPMRGRTRIAAHPPSAFRRKRLSLSLRTTIRSRILPPAIGCAFKLPPVAIAP